MLLNVRPPNLLSQEDLDFERNFTKTIGSGLFLNHQIRDSILPEWDCDPSEKSELLLRWEDGREKLRQLQADLLRNNGCSDLKIEKYFETFDAIQNRLNERRRGYCGWLGTVP